MRIYHYPYIRVDKFRKVWVWKLTLSDCTSIRCTSAKAEHAIETLGQFYHRFWRISSDPQLHFFWVFDMAKKHIFGRHIWALFNFWTPQTSCVIYVNVFPAAFHHTIFFRKSGQLQQQCLSWHLWCTKETHDLGQTLLHVISRKKTGQRKRRVYEVAPACWIVYLPVEIFHVL